MGCGETWVLLTVTLPTSLPQEPERPPWKPGFPPSDCHSSCVCQDLGFTQGLLARTRLSLLTSILNHYQEFYILRIIFQIMGGGVFPLKHLLASYYPTPYSSHLHSKDYKQVYSNSSVIPDGSLLFLRMMANFAGAL